MSNFSRFFFQYRQYLFPQRICSACGAVTGSVELCPACKEKLLTISRCAKCATFIEDGAELCIHCQENEKLYFSQARAALPYGGKLRDNILGFKYYGKTWLTRPLTSILKDLVEMAYRDNTFDLIVPVPLSAERLKSRGYNQTELLAKALSGQLEVTCTPSALKRTADTPPLSSLSRPDRLRILANAFIAEEALVKNKTILLIDDIFTTGATAVACSKALKKAGAKDIKVAAIAAGRT